MSDGFLKEASTCRIEAAADIRIEHPSTGVLTADSVKDGFDCIHRAAPWSESVGVRFEACLPLRFQSRFDDGLHHPVLAGRDAEGPVWPGGLGKVTAADQCGPI